MRALNVLSAIIFCVFGAPLAAAPIVSAAEMIKYNPPATGYTQLASSGVSGAPVIEVASPRLLEQPIKSPMRIELVFKPTDAPVVMDSFQVLYGSAKFNITSRILREATVSSNIVRVEKADLPAGEHRFLVSITDTKGRLGNREISVKVQ